MYSSSKPISIGRPSKAKYSFNDSNNNISYIFELLIRLNNNKEIIISKIEKKKYCDILLENNNINYSDIEYYELKVIELNNNNELLINDNFNNNLNSYSKNDNILYIEFSHNSAGYARATCYVMSIDINSYIISPPN